MSSALVLSYQGTEIRERGEMLSLTDMWKAGGSDPSKAPAQWLRSDAAQEFVSFVADLQHANSHDDVLTVDRGGRSPGTWAHWHVGLAYAKYLSPEFHVWCNQVVRAYMEGRLGSAPANDVRERELSIRERELTLREREFRASGFEVLLEKLPTLSPEVRSMLLVKAAEVRSGESMLALLPPADPEWLSPTQIADRFSVTANRVGRVISALGIRNVEGMSRAITNKSQHSDRAVVSFLYSPEAIEKIGAELRKAG